MMRLFLFLFCLISLMGSFAHKNSAHASETPPLAKPVLNAALAEADYPPFYFVENKGDVDSKFSGISIDVLAHISQKLDIQINYIRLPWPRVLVSLKTGVVSSLDSSPIDLVTTFFNNAERAESVVYTGIPHAFESSSLFVLKENDLTYDGRVRSLTNLYLGAIRGYSYGAEFDRADYLTVEHVLDEPTLVQMMSGGRFDAAIGNPYAIHLEAQRQNVAEALRFIEPAVDRSPIYMAISRKREDAVKLASQFTEQIYQFKQSPEYRALLVKYEMSSADF